MVKTTGSTVSRRDSKLIYACQTGHFNQASKIIKTCREDDQLLEVALELVIDKFFVELEEKLTFNMGYLETAKTILRQGVDPVKVGFDYHDFAALGSMTSDSELPCLFVVNQLSKELVGDTKLN